MGLLRLLTRILKVTAVVLALGVGSAGLAVAGPFEAAEAAYRAGRFEVAREALAEMVRNNDPRGLYLLARMNYRGEGGPRDLVRARALYTEAAEQGHRDAQYMMGYMLRQGEGGAKDPAQSLAWFERAAEQGDGEAMNNIGWAYEHGLGVTANVVTAVEKYRGAVEAGFEPALRNLLTLFAARPDLRMPGFGGWLEGVAARGGAEARLQYARWLEETGTGDGQRMLGWYRDAAELGHPTAQARLGRMYLYGIGVPADVQEGERWLRAAYNAGSPEAAAELAALIALGMGSDKRVDEERAFELAQWAADRGNPEAQRLLATFYSAGRGIPVDPVLAYAWAVTAEQTDGGKGDEGGGLINQLSAALSPSQRADAERRANELGKTPH